MMAARRWRGRRFSDAERMLAFQWILEGVSYVDIAAELDCSSKLLHREFGTQRDPASDPSRNSSNLGCFAIFLQRFGIALVARSWAHQKRATLSCMNNSTVTIRLDAKLQQDLDRLSRQLGRSRSDLVRDAVRRQVALLQFEEARRQLLPLAEAQGVLTDEDVFETVS
jgi:predicted transcriptional regulator